MLLAPVTVSLDGYMAGPEISRELPMGAGGARLHQWIFDPTPTDSAVLSDFLGSVGAVVLGRRTFEVGLPHWNNDTPYPAPSFVVTHHPHEQIRTKSASFVFMPDLLSAVDRARTAAGEKSVVLMGGDLTQQALQAGLVDEIRLQLAPITLGSGTRLFTGREHHTFECVDARVSSHVTHLRFRNLGGSPPLRP